jgi:hypothetical protein
VLHHIRAGSLRDLSGNCHRVVIALLGKVYRSASRYEPLAGDEDLTILIALLANAPGRGGLPIFQLSQCPLV